MAGKKRNYKAEYRRRMLRGQKRGLTRTQSRGHGGIKPTGEPFYDPRLESGLKEVRRGQPLASAARLIRVAPERLRGYLRGSGVATKSGGRWQIGSDNRIRELPIYSGGRYLTVQLGGYSDARLAGQYWDAVGRFLETNQLAFLKQFEGRSVVDLKGKQHVLETRPNVLYGASVTAQAFEEIYRIVV